MPLFLPLLAGAAAGAAFEAGGYGLDALLEGPRRKATQRTLLEAGLLEGALDDPTAHDEYVSRLLSASEPQSTGGLFSRGQREALESEIGLARIIAGAQADIQKAAQRSVPTMAELYASVGLGA